MKGAPNETRTHSGRFANHYTTKGASHTQEALELYPLYWSEMDTATRVQIWDEVVYVSLRANSIAKGMHSSIPNLSKWKLQGRLYFLAFEMQMGEEKENF